MVNIVLSNLCVDVFDVAVSYYFVIIDGDREVGKLNKANRNIERELRVWIAICQIC